MSIVNDSTLRHTSDYHDRFDTEFYLKAAYSGVDIDPNEAPFSAFFIEGTTRILKNAQARLGNTKALEFGGGPCLWSSFLLAQYVQSIQFCDYTQKNLDAVSNWIDGNEHAFDWTNFFVTILDAHGTSRDNLPQWESRLRDALKQGGVSRCDINDSNCPILAGPENQYDIIFSSLCLEAACLTVEMFDRTIERLVRLLKPGGLLLLLTIRNESFYYVDKEKFFCLPLNETIIKHALEQTNKLADIRIDSSDVTTNDKERNTVSDFDGTMIVQAYKRTDK